jgi:uncharacterized protein YbjT (DUF2867 family)
MSFQGEDLIRESGIPYTIVRPCALTEEPAGADLIFDQGDNITGKISREEIAFICVAALASPNAVEKTFEVKILQLICKTLLGTTKLQKEIVAFYFILS